MPEASDGLRVVLSRLEKVRRAGKGYTACCPAHADKSPSLSVTQGDNGVILYCFGGCATDDILGAIGLTFSDLYPPRDTPSKTPEERARARQAIRESQWAAALTTLARDVLLLQAAAGMLSRAIPLTPQDLADLTAAAARIDNAKETLCGRR